MATANNNQSRGNGSDPRANSFQALQDDTRDAVRQARSAGEKQYQRYRDQAADELEALAEGARSASDSMAGRDSLGLSRHVADLAGQASSLAHSLQNRSAEELLQQAGQLARRNPGLFLVGSVALGFGLSRFLGASQHDESTGSGDLERRRQATDMHPAIAADEEVASIPSLAADVHRPGVSGAPGTHGINDPAGPFAEVPNNQNPAKGDFQ